MKTAITLKRLQELNEALLTVPDDFHLHPKMARVMDRRRDDLRDPDAPAVDWATAESLALASILEDGDCGADDRAGRGARHVQPAARRVPRPRNGPTYTPLQALPQAKASFEILNSPLKRERRDRF